MKIIKGKKIIFAAVFPVIIVAAAALLYLYSPRYELIELTTLNGEYSSAMAINNAGQVVGCSKIDNKNHAFIWHQDTGIRDLGTLGGPESFAWDINEKWQVVGHSDTTNGPRHAFLWDPNTGMIDLGTPGGAMSEALAINNKGQIVGSAQTKDGQSHAFLWEASTGMIDIVGPNGQSSIANGINDSGTVAGYIFDPNKNNYDAFIWKKDTGLTRLNIPAIESYAGKINEKGQFVGYLKTQKLLFVPAKEYSFVRTNSGRIIYLNRFAGHENQEMQACDINDNGWIAGDYKRSNSTTRAILLKPKHLFK